MNPNIKVILVVIALIACSLSCVTAFKPSPTFKCDPGSYVLNFLGEKKCVQCAFGFYCDGTNSYVCPKNTISDFGAAQCTQCPKDTRAAETQSVCILGDTPIESTWVRYSATIPANPSGISYFYITSFFNAGKTVKFNVSPSNGPVTIYMSTTTGRPGPTNYEIMSTNVNPSFTIAKTSSSVFQPYYFAIKTATNVQVEFNTV